MPFITQGKTNWKFLVIVIILAVIVGGGALWYAKRPEKPYQPLEIKKSETADWKTYRNEQFGFTLTLSQGWQGYSVTTSPIEYGWKVVIRNPQWTETNPYEDIPILVYPIEQWKKWEANNFEDYPTAAPFGPLERGRNSQCVFATAPRYNYDYRTGWEDVENIIKTLKAF